MSTDIIEIEDPTEFIISENYDNFCEIAKLNQPLSYNDFFNEFLLKNKPCLLCPTNTNDWPSRRHWNKNNAPNFEILRKSFGDCTVPIANCNKKYFNSQCKDNMQMKDYLSYWIDYIDSNYSNSKPCLYLKDWHCIKTYPNCKIYQVPKYFASDWLNEYYSTQKELDDDYMFVYMGPKGTWTPFHIDVFTSYSWSANIVGQKRWLLFPPGEENCLKNANGDLPYDVECINLDKIKYFEVVQNPGEIIFVPSGWSHQVWNLKDTISINHNWLNGCNIMNVWVALQKELESVIKEIEDCKEMENWKEHCQIMLKASFGMNYIQFFQFLSFIAESRLNVIVNQVPVKTFHQWCLGKQHCIFDLKQISLVLQKFTIDIAEKDIRGTVCNIYEDCKLLTKINEIVKN